MIIISTGIVKNADSDETTYCTASILLAKIAIITSRYYLFHLIICHILMPQFTNEGFDELEAFLYHFTESQPLNPESGTTSQINMIFDSTGYLPYTDFAITCYHFSGKFWLNFNSF